MTNLLFKEMVQNAEDAGAKCMKILYDNTNIEPGGTSNIRQYLKVSYYLAIRLLSMGEGGLEHMTIHQDVSVYDKKSIDTGGITSR
jgi:hypothetical protein